MSDPDAPAGTAGLTERIREHYDRLTPLYHRLWGEHIHHGLWSGDESAAEAQANLVRHLADRAGIPEGALVLDVGCGLGGSARWLAGRLGCRVAGLTLSGVQAARARDLSRPLVGRVAFVRADAASLPVRPGRFDAAWMVECAEHLADKPALARDLASALAPGGVVGMCGWFRGEAVPDARSHPDLAAVLDGMLLPSLASMSETADWFEAAGLSVRTREDLTARVARTWEECLRIARSAWARALLPFLDGDTRRFIASFGAMRAAYASGAMVYGLIAARSTRTGGTAQSARRH